MMLVRYQGEVVGFVDTTTFGLIPQLQERPEDDLDRRRVTAVCLFALDVRARTGYEPGRQPHERQRS